MLRKDQLKPVASTGAAGSTADAAEVERFNRLANEWWRPDGAFKVVHRFNAARVVHIGKLLGEHFNVNPGLAKPLDGLTLVDIGSGAGLVSEPMARLGARVTGIDAAARNTAVSAHHAQQSGVAVEYRTALPETLVAEGRQFDVVLSLEVVEHVADVPAFLESCADLLKPGGLMVIGTLNRTAKSYALAIVGAEYVLGWLPKGTHDWSRFITPDELGAELTKHGCTLGRTDGVALNPLTGTWFITRDTSVNYLRQFRKPLPPI
jgi:2-polyprenyl-6-hydroxyphenyl methylase / 3-demethylubiquinone-9 3-methyltransferase